MLPWENTTWASHLDCCRRRGFQQRGTWCVKLFSPKCINSWVQIMHNTWIRCLQPQVCCPSAQSTPEMFRFHLGRRNAVTALSQSRSSHLCLSCCHLSNSVPECCQRPSAVSPSPRAWKNHKLPESSVFPCILTVPAKTKLSTYSFLLEEGLLANSLQRNSGRKGS